MPTINISIGIPAFNEEANIGALLRALKEQKTARVRVRQIIVIASGCTDGTVAAVKKLQSSIPELDLIIQKKRRGKASAINDFLKAASENICVVSSADIIPAPDAIERLCAPFEDQTVGMTGAHPVPANSKNSFLGYAVHTLWELHHKVALKKAKCGEMIAFRKIFDAIPAGSPVDEASIEYEIQQKGLLIRYVPEAVVENKGPVTIKELVKQRRRINYGHIWIKKKYRHKVSTGKMSAVAPLAFKRFNFNMKENMWLLGLLCLEIWSRILASFDYYIAKKSYTVWEQIAGTKNLHP